MGQALYRKYRSKSLDEIVGQEHVTETLRRAIESNRISHAYLFTGPHGVGKTSVARILAHELNGVPYTGEDSHLDIIEIDAASNGGVEEIRDLRDKVHIAPSGGKYKVYIIDEVHMMTASAFNALLKTLEEPPAHTIFILATTEAHKLPATIISRTQRFTFRPIARDKMLAHLKHIANEEKIKVDADALELIAEHSEGSFRDAISMLDQASSSTSAVSRTTIETLLGIPPAAVTERLVAALSQHDAGSLTVLLRELRTDGYQAVGIAKQLGQSLRADLVNGRPPLPAGDVLSLLARLIDIPGSHNAEQMLEIVLLEATLRGAPSQPVVHVHAAAAPPAPIILTVAEPQATPAAGVAAPVAAQLTAESQPTAEDGGLVSTYTLETLAWQNVLDALKKQYNTLYGIIRMADPTFEPGKLTLTFGFAFHQKRANDPKNKKILLATIEEITGEKLAVDCKFDKNAKPAAPLVPSAAVSLPASEPALGAISAVFGGGEVLKP